MMRSHYAALLTFLVLLLAAGPAWAGARMGTTGKIAGTVTDPLGDPLPGVQIVIEETGAGAVTDVNGFYQIINVKPGTYTLVFRFVGFATTRIENVEVIVDQTTTVDARLQEEVIEGQEVVVTAERPLIEMSRTTTTSVVSEEELQALPVTGLDQVVNLQAGVVDGHFRGGRIGEVSYLVNGVPINNPYSNTAAFQVEQNMVSSLEVISGVFNAEYGQAMSGVVNIVTKDVPREWTGSAEGYIGGIASTRKVEYVERVVDNTDGRDLPLDRFVSDQQGNLITFLPPDYYLVEDFQPAEVAYSEVADITGRRNAQFSFGGPVVAERWGLQLSGRYYEDQGHTVGRRLFMPSDSSLNIASGRPSEYVIQSSGDGSFVPSTSRRYTLNGSTVFRLSPKLKLDYNGFFQWNRGRPYAHQWKYVPDGLNRSRGNSQTHIGSVLWTINNTSFANLSYSYLRDRNRSFLYELPDDFEETGTLDSRYVSGRLASLNGVNGFQVGGNELFNWGQRTQTHTIVADYTNQIDRVHQIKVGASARFHNVFEGAFGIDNGPETGYQAIPSIEPIGRDTLNVKPYELAAYIQDKMEFKNLIVNAGLRFDLFEPDYVVPLDWAQGNAAQIANIPGTSYYDASQPDSALISNREAAPLSWQISPRIGVAFPISAQGVVRFSAGLFFQTPPFQRLYDNPEFEVQRGSDAFFGNPGIEPERTLTFEVGLQQGLTESLGLELTLFSKDIRNLIGQRYLLMPNGQYVVYLFNRDVGTVRGVTLSLFQRPLGPVSWDIDYTLQFAEGTSSDPGEAFARFRSGQDDIISLVRLDWDRRHVLNNTFTFAPSQDFRVTLINRFQTGRPYTTVRRFITSFTENNADRPTSFFTDLRLYYRPGFIPYAPQLFLQVDNLFDSESHQAVYSDTGRADESVTKEIFRRSGTPIGGVNSLDEFYFQQGWFSAPRRISIGLRYDL